MKKCLSKLTALSAAVAGLGMVTSAQALDLTYIEGSCATVTGCVAAPYVTYGDGNSYSLPVLGILYDIIVNGATAPSSIQPGNPYYVNSTPGAIKDLTVIGTGSDGNPVTTNDGLMDDAYPTPNSDGSVFFTTNKDAYGYRSSTTNPFSITAPANVLAPVDPGDTVESKKDSTYNHIVEFTGDGENTWDIRLSALDAFVGTESPIFFFNNNQVNSGDATNQNLAIWAVLTLYDDQGVLQPLNLYFTNGNEKYALVSEGGGGDLFGTAGSGTLGATSGPIAGDNENTDYVLSGGALCYTALFQVVSCSNSSAVGGPINHNLGANEAVYAVVFPKLNELLASATFGGYDSLSLDWRMGCDPRTTDGDDADTLADCTARSLNNGYEQLFIGKASTVVNVPEPGTLALLGSALLGFGAMRRRKAKA